MSAGPPRSSSVPSPSPATAPAFPWRTRSGGASRRLRPAGGSRSTVSPRRSTPRRGEANLSSALRVFVLETVALDLDLRDAGEEITPGSYSSRSRIVERSVERRNTESARGRRDRFHSIAGRGAAWASAGVAASPRAARGPNCLRHSAMSRRTALPATRSPSPRASQPRPLRSGLLRRRLLSRSPLRREPFLFSLLGQMLG